MCTAGQTVTIDELLQNAVANTTHYGPNAFDDVFAARDAALQQSTGVTETRFEVINTTTLAAARSLVDKDPSRRVVCLNFASAKNPGGGFLSGSQAQEESLARATGLYACINGVREYYDTNRECGTCLYTDHMIYSPDVPAFRDDRDELLSAPYSVSIITAPAVNAGALAKSQPDQIEKIANTMIHRIEKVLALAVAHGHRSIVLGAWGCGVFKNDPRNVAEWFHDRLCTQVTLRYAFDRVIFAILDTTTDLDIIRPFQDRFSENL